MKPVILSKTTRRLVPAILTLTLLLAALCIIPVSAFTAEEVDISVQPDGSATITADYSLSWIEGGIFMTMKNSFQSAAENGLNSIYKGKATLNSISRDEASVTIPGFAKVIQETDAEGTSATTYKTAPLPYDKANRLVQEKASQYLGIVAGMIPKNVYPETTTISFPDGYTESFGEVTVIPSVVHTIPA